MWTSDRRIALEAALGAALVFAMCAGLSFRDVFAPGPGFHPAWIAVLVLAARYGTSGLLISVALTWGLLVAASLALGRSLDGLERRLGAGGDAMALAAAIVVAWVANLHAARVARAEARATENEGALHEAKAVMAAMQSSLASLRARWDRMEVSLSFWRELAGRLERGDAREAAQAALVLCAVRSGAAAGAVHRWDGAALQLVAHQGHWSREHASPREVGGDRTALAAVTSGRATVASEVPGVTVEDADVAAPIVDGRGVVLGAISLRGVSPARLTAADLADLGLTASWLAPALHRRAPARRPREEAARP